jgi:hypothetical protein
MDGDVEDDLGGYRINCGTGWAQSPWRARRRCCKSALVVAAIFSLLSRGAEAVLHHTTRRPAGVTALK